MGKHHPRRSHGSCLCGAVTFEIDVPAFWAWHDHGLKSRLAHGAAYATYVGCWRKNYRLLEGASEISRYADPEAGTIRSFCSRCGSPLLYERTRSPHMVNIPRALFLHRTGREPRYHLNIQERPDWSYSGEKLVSLKGYPGVVWTRPRTRKRPPDEFD